MRKFNNRNANSDNCEIHKKNKSNKYINYCFHCKRHLCNECLQTREHIKHEKINIIEIQPTKEELDKIKNIIYNYQEKIESLRKKKFINKKELNNLINSKNHEKEIKQKLKINIKNKEEELKINDIIYLGDIEDIKKRYNNELIRRKNKFIEDKNKIINKYKLIYEKEKIKVIYKKNNLYEKYIKAIQNISYEIGNLNNLKKINEIIYNTYNTYNYNYYNSINLRNVLLSFDRKIDFNNDNMNKIE